MSLSEKALLVNLHISQWTGRKLDKRATGTVENTYTTQGKVGQYTKKLLPGAKELEEIQRLANSTRAYFYEQTLPWFSDGSRIISSKNYIDFTKEFNKRKSEFDSAVEKFLNEYPMLRGAARAKLGDLFVESEYPTTSALRHTFKCDVAFMPLPDVKDFRVEVLDSEKDSFIKRMKDVETAAMQECWNRLYEVVSKAAAKLSDKNGIFRDSLIENMTDLCKLLPKLNISDDPHLENMRQELEKAVSNIKPDICRESKHAREHAAKTLSDIESKMSVFMGG